MLKHLPLILLIISISVSLVWSQEMNSHGNRTDNILYNWDPHGNRWLLNYRNIFEYSDSQSITVFYFASDDQE